VGFRLPSRASRRLCAAALAWAAAALAQDLRSVESPDGQIEFHLFIAEPEPAALFRLAYQVSFRGQPAIETSFLGLDVYNQSLLGENLGLISSKAGSGDGYHSLIAEYLQNGSLGRRINVEVRAYNDGVAFRYVVPRSTPLIDLQLEDETTEFELTKDARALSLHQAVGQIGADERIPLPFLAEEPGVGWVEIAEVPAGSYPHIFLTRTDDTILISRLPPRPDKLYLAFEAPTPLVGPWRVLALGATREQVADSKLISRLRQEDPPAR